MKSISGIVWGALIGVGFALGSAGCQSPSEATAGTGKPTSSSRPAIPVSEASPAPAARPGQAKQRYDFATVKRRAKRLKPGMSKVRVLILLGSPSENKARRWIYRQNPDDLLPGPKLIVSFENDRVVGHEIR